ncbi:hypothetical protein KAT80_02060 [Candidatus Pacearchaeota archaeon]|nr:hypothetical protein [Candidatus Pacearchaeota archaeon]
MTNENFYKAIDQKQDYDGENLIQHYENFQDMNKWLQVLTQDSENTGVWEDAGGLLRKNPRYYFNAKRSPRSDLEDTLSEESNNLARYAENNSPTFYGKLGPEDYSELIQKVPLYKTGDGEHDEFVDVINELGNLAGAREDPNKMHAYVQEKISKAPMWAQISFARYGENDLSTLFESYLINADAELKAKMYDENKEIKHTFLEKVFKDSLDEAEKEVKKEDYSEKEKNDVWERNVKPYHMALLEGMYKKGKKDEDKPQKNEARDQRRNERREKGMPF